MTVKFLQIKNKIPIQQLWIRIKALSFRRLTAVQATKTNIMHKANMHDQYYIWGCYLYWYIQYDTFKYFCKSVDGMSVQHFLQHFILISDKISPLIGTLHKQKTVKKMRIDAKNPRNKPFLTYFWDYFHWLFFVQTDQFKRRGWDSNPCALSDKRFSRPPRYDHFDTSAKSVISYSI